MRDTPNDTTAGWPWHTVRALPILVFVLTSACAADKSLQREASWASHFTEAAERIEARAHVVGLTRMHDVRAEQAELRGWMETLSKEMALGGAEAQGPGHYALGCGARALGQDAEARTHLEAAWNAGFREPHVAWARAQALSEHYRVLRLAAIATPDADERKVREKDVERQYRQPVLTLLRQASGAEVPSADFGAALVALHEDRLDAALALLESVGTRHPWFVEARLLRADVFLLRAAQRWASNDKVHAREDLMAGRQALTEAATTAESFAPAYLARARFETAALNLTRPDFSGAVLLLTGGDPGPMKWGVEALDLAARVDPGNADFACEKARFLNTLTERPDRDEPFSGALRQDAIEAAKHALELDAASTCGRVEWSRAFVLETEEATSRGTGGSYQLKEALELLETTPPSARDFAYQLLRARLLGAWTDNLSQLARLQPGSPGAQRRDQAIEAYRSALALEERIPTYWVRLGELLLARAMDPATKDALADLEQAEAAWVKSVRVNTRAPEVWLLEARIRVAQAQRRRARGEEAGPELEKVASFLDSEFIRQRRNPYLHHQLGRILLEQAKETWEHGGDPSALLDKAEAAHVEATKLASYLDLGRFGQAEVHALRAEYAWWRGADPTAAAARADALYLQTKPTLRARKDERFEGLAKMAHLQARQLLEQGRDPEPTLRHPHAEDDAMEWLSRDRVVQHRATGEFFRVMARYSARTNQPKAEEQFSGAEQNYEEALKVEPSNQQVRLEEGHLFREWAVARKAAKQDAEPLLSKGLTLANALLAERPNWAEALLLRAALLRTKDPGSAQARADRDAALKANANLAPGWMRQFPEDGPLKP
ncbi:MULTISPECIES: hypothetical protein [unclassified Corallococcus]|uniref:hypothetical protein n=1 Tax=unclassified Corallococcus TaxID=2685029 RepID=UPI001A8FFEBF|nr:MULTISPECIES: hypothetical protein [unclassified Corallococcus]MBN9683616.1 hypothetical protein [Corallococcus sp. NCSPR001]WAS84872.1 hypothetical protein O0N60_37125 [Corallococcus sp. NCRR]